MKQKGSMKKRKKNNCMFAFGKKLDAFRKNEPNEKRYAIVCKKRKTL